MSPPSFVASPEVTVEGRSSGLSHSPDFSAGRSGPGVLLSEANARTTKSRSKLTTDRQVVCVLRGDPNSDEFGYKGVAVAELVRVRVPNLWLDDADYLTISKHGKT